MKSFEEFRQEQLAEQQDVQLDEIKWPSWLPNPLNIVKGAADVAGKVIKPVVSQVGKTAKKAWDGGDKEVGATKGRDEKGLPQSN